MQKREKILAGGFGTVIVLWLGLPLVESTFLEPIQALRSREEMLRTQQAEKHKSQIELAGKNAKLAEWRKLSLPPNRLNAQRLYEEWLSTLAKQSGFEITKVSLPAMSLVGSTYYTVPVKIEAKATLQELATFFERFQSVDLLHRIARCQIDSPSSEGDPEMKITLDAEGISMLSAPERARLFEQTELAEPLGKGNKTLQVVSSKGFPPTTPFLVRVGEEFLNVTDIKDNVWTVQRGVEKTFATAHVAQEPVEYFPARPRSEAEAATLAMWSQSIFTKPAPQVKYDPKLANAKPPTAIRGQPWTWTLEVSGWNPAFGAPMFQLLSGPEKMELDERKGTLKWQVTDQTEVGDHPVQVLVWGSNGKNAGFTPSVNIRVRNPNQKPVIEESKPLRFFVGRESRLPVKATDPDGTPLKYSLTQSPNGMTIDAATGELRWTPPESMAPGPIEVTVQVTDSDESPESVTLKMAGTLEEDSARFTYLTGRVGRSDGPVEAWLSDRITGRQFVIREGDNVNIADFELTVKKIAVDHILVERYGQLWQLDFMVPLVQMRQVTPAAESKPLPAEAVSVPAAGAAPTASPN